MLSDNLRELRTCAGLTQQQMADALAIDRSTYTYYEVGHTRPDVFTLLRIAKIFNVSCDTLLDNNIEIESVSDDDAKTMLHSRTTDYSRLLNGMATSELSRDEQNLVLVFRQLSDEKRDEFIEMSKKYLQDYLTESFCE